VSWQHSAQALQVAEASLSWGFAEFWTADPQVHLGCAQGPFAYQRRRKELYHSSCGVRVDTESVDLTERLLWQVRGGKTTPRSTRTVTVPITIRSTG
jgi:hypothetical protein